MILCDGVKIDLVRTKREGYSKSQGMSRGQTEIERKRESGDGVDIIALSRVRTDPQKRNSIAFP